MSRQISSDAEEHFQPIATFVLKTFAILSSPENAQAIAWHEDGSCFIIKNTAKMVKDVLPRYFRHHKYESFIRQLNMYNFSKVKSVEGPCFANDYFKQGRDDLLKFIKRKPEKKKKKNACDQEFTENVKIEEKENLIKMISASNFPAKTKDQIQEECEPVFNFLKKESTQPRMERKVTFAEDARDFAEENISTMMEPSHKWLTNKEESCWQNFKSSKSMKISMQLLPFQEEGQQAEEGELRLRSRKSRLEPLTLKYIDDK